MSLLTSGTQVWCWRHQGSGRASEHPDRFDDVGPGEAAAAWAACAARRWRPLHVRKPAPPARGPVWLRLARQRRERVVAGSAAVASGSAHEELPNAENSAVARSADERALLICVCLGLVASRRSQRRKLLTYCKEGCSVDEGCMPRLESLQRRQRRTLLTYCA